MEPKKLRTWTLPSGARVTFEGTPQAKLIRAFEEMVKVCQKAYRKVKDNPNILSGPLSNKTGNNSTKSGGNPHQMYD